MGFHGRASLEIDNVIPLCIGDHIELHVAGWSVVSNAHHPMTHDEEHVSLMQHGQTTPHNHASTCGIGLPPASHEGGIFQFQANAPAFVPGVPWGLDALDEFIQDLFALWDETAFAWEDRDRSCSVAVWFVDHHWQNPHCVAPRVVRLYPDVHEWRRQLWQAWQEQIIPGHELEFSIVSPRPPTVDATVAAHVVIIQRPNDFWVTSVVSCFEFGSAVPRLTQMAVTTHEHILLENIARVMGFFEACFGHTRTKQCVAAYGTLPIQPGAPLAGRSGYGIVVSLQPLVHVQTPLRPVAETLEDDAHSFLMIPGRTFPSSRSLSMSRPCRSSAEEPLSLKAVLIPLNCCVQSESVCTSAKIRQAKVSDHQSPATEGQLTGIYQGLVPIAIPTNGGAPVVLPNFVLDIMRAMQPTGVRANGEIAGLVIRVWYIHHRWHRLARIARYLQLSGPPSSWQAQVLALWLDRLTPHDAIGIHLVKPQPFRNQHEQSIAFDVIVTQGLNEPRKAGLVSLFPSHSDLAVPLSLVAVSCRLQLSGAWLLRALELDQICQIHRCLILHGWNEVPHTHLTSRMS